MRKKYLLLLLFIYQFLFSHTDSFSYYYNKVELDKAIKYGENIVQNNVF